MGIGFEYTARATPEQNGKVERKFATLYARTRAMFNGARLPERLREGVWTEAASTATNIENALISMRKKDSSDIQMLGEETKGLRGFRTFGEMSIINKSEGKTMRRKLDDRGIPCMYLGHAKDHGKDVHRFLNIQTNKVIISRDET